MLDYLIKNYGFIICNQDVDFENEEFFLSKMLQESQFYGLNYDAYKILTFTDEYGEEKAEEVVEQKKREL